LTTFTLIAAEILTIPTIPTILTTLIAPASLTPLVRLSTAVTGRAVEASVMVWDARTFALKCTLAGPRCRVKGDGSGREGDSNGRELEEKATQLEERVAHLEGRRPCDGVGSALQGCWGDYAC
jgi:hypothetical protein